MRGDDWRRYAAPAAFLLAVTVAVVLIHSGLESGGRYTATRPGGTSPPPARQTTATTPRTSARGKGAAKRFWTVRAGDTFGVIAQQTGVSVSQLQRLNPKVSSTALYIGERVRIR